MAFLSPLDQKLSADNHLILLDQRLSNGICFSITLYYNNNNITFTKEKTNKLDLKSEWPHTRSYSTVTIFFDDGKNYYDLKLNYFDFKMVLVRKRNTSVQPFDSTSSSPPIASDGFHLVGKT